MCNAIQLNLPKPSTMLVNLIREDINSTVIDRDIKRWLDEFQDNTINSSLQLFYNPNEEINTQLRKEYQHFFTKHKIKVLVGYLKNAEDSPACLPPHIDRARTLAINFYIDLGGTNVSTIFYDIVKEIRGEAYNFKYSELSEPIESIVFDQNWYAYNVNRCHSVENIESTRFFMAIRMIRDANADLDFHYDLEEFKKDYPELIKN